MEWLQSLADRLAHLGLPLFIAAYVISSILPVPTWPLKVAAGVIFGYAEGLALLMLTSCGGSFMAYLLARYSFRRKLRETIRKHPKLASIDKALADGGWRAVALLQMSPAMPLGLQNYLLGASRVRWRPYLIGTTLGILPSATMYVIAGASGRRIADLSGPSKWALLAVGAVATLLLTTWMGRLAKRHYAAAG